MRKKPKNTKGFGDLNMYSSLHRKCTPNHPIGSGVIVDNTERYYYTFIVINGKLVLYRVSENKAGDILLPGRT
jgi:hypothetical protein